MTQTNIAILGAGIAGLCSAIALAQKGFHVTLFERSAKPKNLGAGLVLWPNAITILDKLELLENIKPLGFTLNKMQRITASGEFLNEIDLKKMTAQSRYSNYAITRESLQNVFIKKLELLKIKIHFNHSITDIKPRENNTAVVYFNNGEKMEADVIIGADGRMKSFARKYVIGSNTPIYQDYVNWVGLIESQSGTSFNNNIMDYWGCGERFGLVPLSNRTAYWAGCKAMPQGLGEPKGGNKNTLLNTFRHWPDNIREIIEQTNDQSIKRIEVFDHDPIAKWHRDNICLIGDAAHAALPTSGQGACQAIEDAYYLAKCLQQTGNIQSAANYQSSFEQFYEQRYKSTTAIIHNARDIARSLFNTDPEFCETRNLNAKHLR